MLIKLFTENSYANARVCGGISSIVALFAPIRTLVLCLFIFIFIDFVTGCWASYKREHKKGNKWYFESSKAWNTIYKFAFASLGVVMCFIMENYLLDFIDADLHIANIFAGFICGVEMWSYLENAAEISNHPVFRWVGKFVKKQTEEKIGVEIPNLSTEKHDEKDS